MRVLALARISPPRRLSHARDHCFLWRCNGFLVGLCRGTLHASRKSIQRSFKDWRGPEAAAITLGRKREILHSLANGWIDPNRIVALNGRRSLLLHPAGQ